MPHAHTQKIIATFHLLTKLLNKNTHIEKDTRNFCWIIQIWKFTLIAHQLVAIEFWPHWIRSHGTFVNLSLSPHHIKRTNKRMCPNNKYSIKRYRLINPQFHRFWPDLSTFQNKVHQFNFRLKSSIAKTMVYVTVTNHSMENWILILIELKTNEKSIHKFNYWSQSFLEAVRIDCFKQITWIKIALMDSKTFIIINWFYSFFFHSPINPNDNLYKKKKIYN